MTKLHLAIRGVTLWTAMSASPGSSLNAVPKALTPDLLNQKIHLSQLLRRLVSTLQFEKYKDDFQSPFQPKYPLILHGPGLERREKRKETSGVDSQNIIQLGWEGKKQQQYFRCRGLGKYKLRKFHCKLKKLLTSSRDIIHSCCNTSSPPR